MLKHILYPLTKRFKMNKMMINMFSFLFDNVNCCGKYNSPLTDAASCALAETTNRLNQL